MRLLPLSPSLTALFATLSLLPVVSSKAAPPNPDQLYALQQAAYLAAAASSTDLTSTTQLPAPPRRRDPQHKSDKKSFHKKIKKSLDKRLRKEVEDEWSKDSSHQLVNKIKSGAHGTNPVKRQNRMEKLRKRTHQHLNRPHSHLVPEFDVQKMKMGPPSTTGLSTNTRIELVKRKGGMFKGVSSYYLFALDDGPRRAVLDAIKGGGFSVVRIFLSGVHGNCKGSGNGPVPDREFSFLFIFHLICKIEKTNFPELSSRT